MRLNLALWVFTLVLAGTFHAVLLSIAEDSQSQGADGAVKPFRKPWAMTAIMFLGMALVLPVAISQERRQRKEVRDQDAGFKGCESPGRQRNSALREIVWIALPSALALFSTALTIIGLQYITASVELMIGGGEMVFAAAFGLHCLGRALNRNQIGGIACCVAGLGMAGAVGVLVSDPVSASYKGPSLSMALGIGLIILAQGVQAAQLTVEDYFMTDYAIAPLKLVAFEGVMGSVMMAAVVLPLTYFLPGKEGAGVHEDIIDTFKMIGNSVALQTIVVWGMLLSLVSNVAGMVVIDQLGAVYRAMVSASTPLLLWLIDFGIFYLPSKEWRLSDAWGRFSPVQLGGFALLLLGLIVYSRSIEDCEDELEADEEAAAERLKLLLSDCSATKRVPSMSLHNPLMGIRVSSMSITQRCNSPRSMTAMAKLTSFNGRSPSRA